MENILTIFTSEDKDEIRKATKEIIIDQIRSDFDNCGCYLIDPRQIEEMVSEVVEEVKEEVRSIYKEKLMKEMEDKLGL